MFSRHNPGLAETYINVWRSFCSVYDVYYFQLTNEISTRFCLQCRLYWCLHMFYSQGSMMLILRPRRGRARAISSWMAMKSRHKKTPIMINLVKLVRRGNVEDRGFDEFFGIAGGNFGAITGRLFGMVGIYIIIRYMLNVVCGLEIKHQILKGK